MKRAVDRRMYDEIALCLTRWGGQPLIKRLANSTTIVLTEFSVLILNNPSLNFLNIV